MPLAHFLPHFQSLPPFPICDWHLSSCYPGAEFQNVGFAYFQDCVGPLNGLSGEIGSFFHCPNPHWFLQPEVLRHYFPVTEPWATQSGVGLGLLAPQQSLQFLSTTHECETALSTGSHHHCLATPTLCPPHPRSPALPLLPIWMNIFSLNPWLLDFHTVHSSGSSSCFWC